MKWWLTWRGGKAEMPELPDYCGTCGVAFKPRPQERFASLCRKCAQPHLDRIAEDDLIRAYASAHRDELLPKAKEWHAELAKKWAHAPSAAAQQAGLQQLDMMARAMRGMS